MNKLKKLNPKILVLSLIVVCAVCAFAAVASVVKIVKAFQVNSLPSSVIIENATFGNAYFGGSEEQGFGAAGDSNFTNVVASGDLTSGDDLTVGDDATIADIISYGGVEHDWIEGSCNDATTTIFSVINPWSDTAYVDFLFIEITNGTSTAEYTIGTSTASVGLSADPSDLLVDDLSVATSTYGTATTTARTYNTSATVTGTSGFEDPGTNSEDLIVWGSSEYIVGYADTAYSGALTEASNMFSCTYKIHSFK